MDHILRRHPVLMGQFEKVREAVAEPDLILRGDEGELLAVRSYPRGEWISAFLVVAYLEVDDEDGFVVTAYPSRRVPTRREVLWARTSSS
jgi:hypothetical protein